MKPWLAVTVLLLLATGCAANDTPAPDESDQAGNTRTSNLSQASSISNMGTGTVSIHQAAGDRVHWLDWFRRAQSPADQSAGRQGNVANTNPGTATNPNTGANRNTGTNQNTGTTNQTQKAADPSQFGQQVLTLVNEARSNAGLKPLSMNAELSRMAMFKAQDMYDNNYFSHDSPTYGSPFQMMKSFGIAYKWAGENIAKGQRSPLEVMNAWMNSPGHKANILSVNFTQIGIAYYNAEWVQAFIG